MGFRESVASYDAFGVEGIMRSIRMARGGPDALREMGPLRGVFRTSRGALSQTKWLDGRV